MDILGNKKRDEILKEINEYLEKNDSLISHLNLVITEIKNDAELSDDNNISKFEELTNRIVELENYLADYTAQKKRQASEEPFINILSERFDPVNGIELKLDWNPAMINHLKRNGYIGVNDDQIIEKYMSDLFNKPQNFNT